LVWVGGFGFLESPYEKDSYLSVLLFGQVPLLKNLEEFLRLQRRGSAPPGVEMGRQQVNKVNSQGCSE